MAVLPEHAEGVTQLLQRTVDELDVTTGGAVSEEPQSRDQNLPHVLGILALAVFLLRPSQELFDHAIELGSFELVAAIGTLRHFPQCIVTRSARHSRWRTCPQSRALHKLS